jgi:hypothetical protein
MSINLWKIGGKPTSYNPLPIGTQSISGLSVGLEIAITFKAMSPSNAYLDIWATTESSNARRITLTNVLTEYKLNLKTLVQNSLLIINDPLSRGDIIIKDFELVQKPLPTLTINGIDGFKSGKWVLHANTKVIDDETLELNATGDFQNAEITIPCLPFTDYYYSAEGLSADFYTSITNTGMTTVYANATNSGRLAFKTGAGTTLRFNTYNGGGRRGTFTFKRPMLNLGSTPAPYEKKRGERMVLPTVKKNLFDGVLESGTLSSGGADVVEGTRVRTKNFIPIKAGKSYVDSNDKLFSLVRVCFYDANKTFISATGDFLAVPSNAYFVRWTYIGTDLTAKVQLEQGTTLTTYEPYAVQVNKKPKRYVPKKNLIQSVEQGGVISDFTKTAATNRVRTEPLTVIPNEKYTISTKEDLEVYFWYQGTDGVFAVTGTGWNKTPYVFDKPNVKRVLPLFRKANDSVLLVSEVTAQLEQGSTATQYEPYQLILPRAKSGLRFEGDSYVQLPSMTMDSIEIDCLIDSVQNAAHYLLDARTGLTNGYVNNSGVGNGFFEARVNGVVQTGAIIANNRGERKKFLFKTSTPFTDDIVLFAGYTGIPLTEKLKATLYGITCYLNGAIVAQYDAQNIVGDKLLQGVKKNLIPSFEDSRWSLHANADVLGKDVLRLEATAGGQISECFISCLPNTSYLFVHLLNNPNGYIQINWRDINNTSIAWSLNTPSFSVISPPNAYFARIYVTNANYVGAVTFIKPQLFQLDGKEAQLVGKPTSLRKASKRTLYAKR